MQKLSLSQIDDEADLEKSINQVIQQNPKQETEYINGKLPLIQFLIGKTMAETQGRANPEKIKTMIEKMLNK